MDTAAANRIAGAFAAKGIAIAVLGCYINPIHPDPDAREKQLRRFEESLRLARDFGCSVVGTETGSLNPDCSWHPDTQGEAAFDMLCRSVERLARKAEDNGCVLGLEPVAEQHSLSSVEKTRRLLERVDSRAIGIIFDPVNLVPDAGLAESCESFFARAALVFGDRIVAVHAKDYKMIAGRKSAALPAGSGELDYPALFRMLEKYAPHAPVILENASPATAPAAMDFIEEAWGKVARH
jgi:sugar phosphate isomerase/epimerase